MDLFLTLGTLWLFTTALFTAIAGRKKALDFLSNWFSAIAIAAGIIGFVWKIGANIWLPPTAEQMAVIVFFFLNLIAAAVTLMFRAGKESEGLRNRV